ncbi:MAG: hypothetical protein KA369_06865 [Spirochaetes bacterium]|nr:hypothetical protein [Spirochaetota bacterium]
MDGRKRAVGALMAVLLCGMAAAAGRHARATMVDNEYFSQSVKEDAPQKISKEQDGTKSSEDDIFGGGDTVTPSEKVKDDTLSDTMEKKSVTLTGFLNARTSVNYKRASILRDIDIIDGSNFLSYFQGNFGLDVRLLKGIRGYFNLSADYYPAGLPQSRVFQVPLAYLGIPAYFTKADLMVAEKVNAVFSINEIFLDVNIARRVYFRLGKQVVKWGVGYLWTPTDLVNIEKKNILDSSQVRQGTYGLKIHVPFGTRANIYSFINMNTARHLSDISMANKVEVLFLNTEMALSVLLKNKNVPVYGFDFTSRILTLDIHGEASLSYGDNTRRLRNYPWYVIGVFPSMPVEWLYLFPRKSDLMDYRVRGRWIPKASLGFGRGFEVLDVKDRIRFDVEAFYNHAGYDRNVFEKDFFTSSYFLSSGLYTPNYYGKWYAGLFITIRQMFVEELSAMINGVVNIQDQSSIVSGMITYAPFYDLSLTLMVNGFVGKTNREYTVYGNYFTSELSIKLVF